MTAQKAAQIFSFQAEVKILEKFYQTLIYFVVQKKIKNCEIYLGMSSNKFAVLTVRKGGTCYFSCRQNELADHKNNGDFLVWSDWLNYFIIISTLAELDVPCGIPKRLSLLQASHVATKVIFVRLEKETAYTSLCLWGMLQISKAI